MPEVTVLGAAGATVTLTLSSAQTAAAAQLAVNKVNALNLAGILDVQMLSTVIALNLNALPPLTKSLGALIIDDGVFQAQPTGDAYRLFAVKALQLGAFISGRNAATTVIAEDNAVMEYGNVSANADVYLGKNESAVVNFEGKVTATTSDGVNAVATKVGSSTIVNVGIGGTVNFTDVQELFKPVTAANFMGATTVNALGSATINAFAHTGDPGLVNMTLKSGNVNIGLAGHFGGTGGASAIINPGAANVTIVGNVAASATLFGGSGSVAVDGVMGNFTGGSAGGNLMRTSTVSGSTTLTGGGAVGTLGDALNAQGANQTLNAGAGNTTLAAVTKNGATGGSIFNINQGISTVFGFEGGGNTINFGGTDSSTMSILLGRNNGVGPVLGNAYNDLNTYGGEGARPQFSIFDFETGLDTLTVKSAFEITFFAANNPANLTGFEVTTLKVSGGGFYTFFDPTADGVQNIFATDVKTV
jgi:hypothetical protein